MSMFEELLTGDPASGLSYSLKKRVLEEYGTTMIGLSPKNVNRYVRLDDGRMGQVISRGADLGTFVVQLDPLGKRRHKNRIECSHACLALLCEMEVLAEASR